MGIVTDLDEIARTEGVPDTKENRILQAKINAKTNELNNIKQTGPVFLVFVSGILIISSLFLGFAGLLIGVILFLFAAWWGNSRKSEINRLKGEIDILKVELG